MPTWLLATLAAIWEAIRPYIAPFVAGVIGMRAEKGEEAIRTKESMNNAADAAADMRGKSFDERVQFLERRSRVRGVPKQ